MCGLVEICSQAVCTDFHVLSDMLKGHGQVVQCEGVATNQFSEMHGNVLEILRRTRVERSGLRDIVVRRRRSGQKFILSYFVLVLPPDRVSRGPLPPNICLPLCIHVIVVLSCAVAVAWKIRPWIRQRYAVEESRLDGQRQRVIIRLFVFVVVCGLAVHKVGVRVVSAREMTCVLVMVGRRHFVILQRVQGI